MKKVVFVLIAFGCFCFTSNAFAQDAAKDGAVTPAPDSLTASDPQMVDKINPNVKYVPVETYDPLRNADKDIQDALAEAKRTNRRVLLEVGGLWCVWCRHMDDFFTKHADVLALREQYFVMLKVNFSDENKNKEVLSRYPNIPGFPHLFVLDANGKLLHSQDTGDLEEGKGYNAGKVVAFLKTWAEAQAK